MTRVAVFIDYENVRFAAREIFGDPRRDPYAFGHVSPLRLGSVLRQLGEKVDSARELTAVKVYRGRPGPKSGPRAQASSARQFAAWESQSLVTVRSRPLRWSPERPHHRMKVPGRRLWNHALGIGRFSQVRDDTDYAALI